MVRAKLYCWSERWTGKPIRAGTRTAKERQLTIWFEMIQSSIANTGSVEEAQKVKEREPGYQTHVQLPK